MRVFRKPLSAKHITTYAVTVGLTVFLIFFGFFYTSSTPTKNETDSVSSRDVVSYQLIPTEGEATVAYEYKGARVPEKLAPDEDVALRTANSYTRVLNPGTGEEPATYNGIFFPQATFTKDGDAWYYIEHATTTETAFNNARKENPLASLFWQKVLAVDIYSGAGDGRVGIFTDGSGDGCDMAPTWSNAVSGVGTEDANASNTITLAQVQTIYLNEPFPDPDTCQVYLYRAFFPFITSSIPSAAVISSATFNVYVDGTGVSDQDNDGNDYLTVVRTTQATHTTLSTSDFTNIGTTEGIDSGQRKDLTSVSTNAYLSFTLNATGISWIAKSGQSSVCSATTGITCLGIREGHDNLNNQAANNTITGTYFSTSEVTGTSQDPYLSVIYTGGSSAFWQFQDY